MRLPPFVSVLAAVAVVGLVAWAKPGDPSSGSPSRLAVDEDAPAAPTLPLPAPTPSAAPSLPAPWAMILPALQRMQPSAPQPATPRPGTVPPPAPAQPPAPPPAPAPAQPSQLPAGLPALPAFPAGGALPSGLPSIPGLPAVFPGARPPAPPVTPS